MGKLDNSFTDSVKKVLRDIQDLKQPQYMGHDLINPVMIPYSNDPYDVTTDGYEYVTVTFTADTQTQPNGLPVMGVYDNAAGTILTNTAAYSITIQDGSHWQPDGVLEYYLNINKLGANPPDIYIKIFFVASDTGSIGVTIGI